MSQPIRFIHASDFYLGKSMSGLEEIPPHLTEVLVDAPLNAATRVFDAAVAEAVDFLVLSGNLLQPNTTSPRCVNFLLDQFDRLERQNIDIFWAPGRVDRPERWQDSLTLPDNVTFFANSQVEEILYERDEEATVGIRGFANDSGRFRTSDFRMESEAHVVIGVVSGKTDVESLKKAKVDYWALGGRPKRRTLSANFPTGHYAGSPQGRSPADTGPRGCTLVQIDDGRNVQMKPITCDAVRWRCETITTHDDTLKSLQRQLLDRCQSLSVEGTDRTVLVKWLIESPAQFHLRHGESTQDSLAEMLRDQFGADKHGLWTVDVEFMPIGQFPRSWQEEDTILGDYLRAVSDAQNNGDIRYDLTQYFDEAGADAAIRSTMLGLDETSDEDILHEAATLGASLLRGD